MTSVGGEDPSTASPGSLQSPGAFVGIGSGSVDVLTFDLDPDTGRRVRRCRQVAPAQAADVTRAFDTDDLSRVETTLVAALDSVGGRPVLDAVATGGVRWLNDTDRIAELVARVCGVELRILSPDQEARFGHAGARALGIGPGRARIAEPFVTLDVGSESTEICGHESSFSLPLGGSTVFGQYLHRDPPGPDQLSAALSVIELHLDDVRRQHPDIVAGIEGGMVVGLGALPEIAAVEIGVAIDDEDVTAVDGYRLERDAAEEVFRALATESSADRAYNPGLKPQHVDSIVGALCLVVEFMRQFAVPEIVISPAGVLDGVAAGYSAAGPDGAH